MRRIDELRLEHPFYGARRLAKQIERIGSQPCRTGRRFAGYWVKVP
jgi:hypothetical protein